MRKVDPTLPRYGTDIINTWSRDLCEVDPTLPRFGTDLLDTASRAVRGLPDATALQHQI